MSDIEIISPDRDLLCPGAKATEARGAAALGRPGVGHPADVAAFRAALGRPARSPERVREIAPKYARLPSSLSREPEPRPSELGPRPKSDPARRPILDPAQRKLIGDLLRAFVSLRRSEAVLLRAEGEHFAFLRSERCKPLAFMQPSDVCRELLLVPDRTARERVTLHRALGKSRKLERLFMDGKLANCQVLAIAPMLDGPDADRWIERARRLTVRKLKEEVRKKKPGVDHPERHSRRRITLDVPVEIAAVLHDFIEVGRKVIGYDCPPGEVVEAILAENNRAGLGNVDTLPRREPPRRRRRAAARMTSPIPPISDFDFAEAERVIERIQEFQEQIAGIRKARGTLAKTGLSASPSPSLANGVRPSLRPTPFRTFDELLRQIRGMHHPLRVLQTRLLRTMRRIRVDRRLGFDTFEDFVADRLCLSPRVARELVSESEMFDEEPALETAFLAGRIGTTKAHHIRTVAGGSDIHRWIGRGEHVLTRAFERECRLTHLLRRYDRRISRRFAGPFPQPGMIAGLSEEVCAKHGITADDLERELRRRGVEPHPPNGVYLDPQGNPLSAEDAQDPAKNPPLMRRLEVLVLLLCTSSAREDDPGRKRQMFAVSEPHILFAFGCSDEVAADFAAMNRAFEAQHGPFVQHWVPFSLAAMHAVDTWTLQDPERIPTQERILRRDEHHCTFPGCTQRSMLEVNHARPQSLGGSDDPSNLHGLCFGHHRDVFHAGYARISGLAPHHLRFEIGIRPEEGDNVDPNDGGHAEAGRPLMITLGNYIIDRP